MDVIIGGQRITLTPQMLWGSGGEAEVYEIGPDMVVKVFKPPDHPDHLTPEDRKAAERRIEEHQSKLLQFPRTLPQNVVAPIGLAYDSADRVVGYVMRFVRDAEQLMRYSEKQFRAGVPNNMVLEIFHKLHTTVSGVHSQNVEIGDFNDLNVLVKGKDPFLIDADSFQFGKFLCTVYTVSFVDPLLCDPKERRPVLNQPHNSGSDWYAFMVMLMRSFLYVGPYGGVYRPKDPANRVPEPMRPLRRVTIFNPEVRYPRPAVHFKVLPDDMLATFHKVFVEDWRGEFPIKILESMRWTKCTKCGIEHARATCPECTEAAPAAVKETVTIRGKVTARRIFRTSGVIVFATIQEGKLLWLYNENNTYKREDGGDITPEAVNPQLRYRIQGNLTYLGWGQQVITLSGETWNGRRTVGRFGTLPVFDANAKHFYWLEQGKLLWEYEMSNGLLGSDIMGNVLMNRTLFWVGETFGFGFSRAGKLNITFVFDAEKSGINDRVKLPPIRGQLMDSTCVFASRRCWFLTATEEGSRRVNRCYVVNRDGTVEAQAEADQGDGSWLGTLRGKLATANYLLASTDDGLIRVEVQNGSIIETQKFPDTTPFVDSESHIFPSEGGIYVVGSNEISLLSIKQ